MYVYVSGIIDYLRGPGQNTEPHFDRMTVIILKLFSLKRDVVPIDGCCDGSQIIFLFIHM